MATTTLIYTQDSPCLEPRALDVLLSESTGVSPQQLFVCPWKTIIVTQCLGKEGRKPAVSKWLSSIGDPRPHSATWMWGESRSLLGCPLSLLTQASPWAILHQDPVLGLDMEELQQCSDLAVTWEWSRETSSFSYGNTRNDDFPAMAVRTQAQRGCVLGGQWCWASGMWISGCFWVASVRHQMKSSDWLQGLDPMCLLSLSQITQILCCWFLFLCLSTSSCDTAAWQVVYWASFGLPRS